MDSLRAHEMVAPRPDGRVFGLEMRPLLGDCAPSGRIRLDAIARWLQDVAFADVEEAGVAANAFWVLRRTRIEVERFPRFSERCLVRTFCSGIGRMWAERRTTITAVDEVGGQRATDGAKPLVEAIALWIHLDPERRVPSPLTPEELETYGASAGDRHVHHRLRHPRPHTAVPAGSWSFRETDCDLADHVNNAAYWEPLEEELLERERREGVELVGADAEIEFRTPAQPGAKTILADASRRWLVDATDGDADGAEFELYASTVLMKARTTLGSN